MKGGCASISGGEQYNIKWGKTRDMLGRAHLSLGGS